MTERDPLDALLREWESPEPTSELDEHVLNAYREAFRAAADEASARRRFWKARISVPVPLLVAGVTIVALLFWIRLASAPNAPRDTANVITRLHATGFEPLPNGEVRVVPVKEMHQ